MSTPLIYVKGDDVKVAKSPRAAVALEFAGWRVQAAPVAVEEPVEVVEPPVAPPVEAPKPEAPKPTAPPKKD